METIFDKVDDTVVQKLSERPEAFADRDFLKRSAENPLRPQFSRIYAIARR